MLVVRSKRALNRSSRSAFFGFLGLAEDSEAESKKWCRLQGTERLPFLVEGIDFTNRVAVSDAQTRAARSGHIAQIQS